MTIGFILNGEDVVVYTEAEHRLIDILRQSFGLIGAKTGCFEGSCGLCSVILNGDIVKSCLIPAFKARGCEIITIEGFSQTDEYTDIIRGFEEAGIRNCGYCDASKILTAESLLIKNPRPAQKEILLAFNGIKCRCTDPDSLVKSILTVAENRQRRLYGR